MMKIVLLLLSTVLSLQFSTTTSTLVGTGRKLTLDRIAGYMPTTDVIDQLMLDLDQYNIEEQVILRKINIAKHIYEQGGHSDSYAVLTMTATNGSYAFEEGSSVWAHNEKGSLIKATLQQDIYWENDFNQTLNISVMYDDTELRFDICQVGAMYLFKSASLENCFASSGYLKIAKPGQSFDTGVEFPYTYNIRSDNKNGKTLQQLSTMAGSIMRKEGGEYFDDFDLFVKYYGQPDYANRWITAAIDKTATNFPSGMGDANFAELEGRDGQGEAMAKGTVFLAVYMYIISRLEESLLNCKIGCHEETCKLTATHYLDEAVAYYAGSLADHSTDNTTGVFFYAFADNRAWNFKTAGHLPTKSTGTSYVNVHIMNHFKEMQTLLKNGNSESCTRATETKNEIIRLMKIPLIQSVLAYAYIRDRDQLSNEEEIEKTEAKGASYAAAILPYVYHCNTKNAEILYNQMRIGSDMNKVNYHDVKRSLESSYQCLNVTCSEIGGIWNGQEYANDASPCGVVTEKKAGLVYFFSFVFVIGFVVLAFLVIRYRRRKSNGIEEMTSSMPQNNIHAVSEIA